MRRRVSLVYYPKRELFANCKSGAFRTIPVGFVPVAAGLSHLQT